MADNTLESGSTGLDARNAIIEDTAKQNLMLSTNIYDIAPYVDAIKAKYIDIPEDTLAMGIYGYLNEIHTNILENTAIVAAEYANECSPTKAQFERNVIAHALSLGINNIRATPAYMNVYLEIPETNLLANMVDDKIVIDKDFAIILGNSDNVKYSYQLDYDIILRHVKLPSGKWIYTAIYDIDAKNEVSTITSPYLPTIGISQVSDGNNMVLIPTVIRQTVHNKIYKKIIVSNPLEFKAITFTFSDQLAYFYLEVTEGNTTHYLKCIYDGLYDTTPDEEYCNYQYIDDSTIRVTFNRDSYQPRTNSDVTIHVFTTNGAACNFDYNATTVHTLNSDRFAYNNLYMQVQAISNSEYGIDKKSVEELHKVIPREMLSRNSITTSKDLEGYFNQISDSYRMYFLQKNHNQIARIFFSYMLLKNIDNNIVPTNTCDVTFGKEMFTFINANNYILPQGSLFYNDGTTTVGLPASTPVEKLKEYDGNGFLYINPFLVIINKNPFLVNYYLNILNYNKSVDFTYINQNSELQFIVDKTINVKRPFFPSTDRDKYTITLKIMQNIASDFNIIGTDEQGNIVRQDIKVIGVMYKDGNPYKYVNTNLLDYDDKEYLYTFEATFNTNDILDRNGNITITNGLKAVNTDEDSVGYLPNNVEFKFFILTKMDKEYGREEHIDDIVPGLDGWTLCNVYEMNTGLDVYYDYTNIMESYIGIHNNEETGEFNYDIKRMPLIRYSYLNPEFSDNYGLNDRIDTFMKLLDTRRSYIQACLVLLEDSFGVDFKFFNTYGPSKLYNVNEKVPLDKVNLSLKFEVKYQSLNDIKITDDITAFIKQYMENINYITDLHIPNLTTAVKNKFVNQLVYFKFVGLNDYGYMYQSIYENPQTPYVDSTFVPEFININTKADNTPDIEYTVYESES